MENLTISEEACRLLTVKETCGRLAISERKLYDLTAPRGPIECVRIGRAIRFSQEALNSFIESHKIRKEETL